MRSYILCSLLVVIVSMASCLGLRERPVTKEEALIMARQIDSAIASENSDQFLGFIQMDVFINRIEVAAKKDLPRSYKTGLRTGMKTANLGGQIINSVKQNGSYQLVKHYEKNNVQHLLYRLYGDGGLNYHDFELTKVDGKVYVADIFIYLTGENFSKSASTLFVTMDEGDLWDDFKKEDIEKFKRISALIEQNRHREAKDIYDKLPAVFKEKKLVQINHLVICANVSDEVYLQALNEFEAKFKDEPYMYISLIDAYIMRKDFDKAMEFVNQLDALIDKDPLLDYVRGVLYNEMGKREESIKALEKVTAGFPDFEPGLTMLVLNYIETANYEKASPVIKAYRQHEHFDQESMDAFLLSYPGYWAWEEKQSK